MVLWEVIIRENLNSHFLTGADRNFFIFFIQERVLQ